MHLLRGAQCPSAAYETRISSLPAFRSGISIPESGGPDVHTRAKIPPLRRPRANRPTSKLLRRTLLGAIEAAAIDRALVRSYTATRRSSGRADGTIDKELRTLRQVLSFAVKEGCIDRAPYIDTPGSGPPRDRWLDKRELNQLIEACVAPHVRAFVLVCVHTGARARQVYNLTWDRVDLWRGLVCFPPSRPRSKKRSVIIPANATLWAELRSLRTVSKSPWVIEHRGHQVSSIKTGFKAAVRRAGIAPCTVHDLRRTCASEFSIR